MKRREGWRIEGEVEKNGQNGKERHRNEKRWRE